MTNKEDNDMETRLDLNELLVHNPGSTFLAKNKGQAWESTGILLEDVLIIDRSLKPNKGDLIIAVMDDQYTVKRFLKELKGGFLLQAGGVEMPFTVNMQDTEFEIWGVVVAVARVLRAPGHGVTA